MENNMESESSPACIKPAQTLTRSERRTLAKNARRAEEAANGSNLSTTKRVVQIGTKKFKKPPPAKAIESNNKNFQILEKMGCKEGLGLGKKGQGIATPIALKFKIGRKGFRSTTKKGFRSIKKKGRKLRGKVGMLQKLHPTTEVQKSAPVALLPIPVYPKETATNEKDVINSNYLSKDSSATEKLNQIACMFHENINRLLEHLQALSLSTPRYSDNDLIVSEVKLGDNSEISENFFEIIRIELVSWIAKYQILQMDTPKFCSITNNNSHIIVVCDNIYSFQCLKKCVEEFSMKHKPVTASPLSLISELLYCFEVVHFGITKDMSYFLKQIKLHHSNLKTEYWIVVSNEVRIEQRETHYIFLLDEASALALTYRHNNKLFINMHAVEFAYMGQIGRLKSGK